MRDFHWFNFYCSSGSLLIPEKYFLLSQHFWLFHNGPFLRGGVKTCLKWLNFTFFRSHSCCDGQNQTRFLPVILFKVFWLKISFSGGTPFQFFLKNSDNHGQKVVDFWNFHEIWSKIVRKWLFKLIKVGWKLRKTLWDDLLYFWWNHK